jgi:antibiotic biosynthesis monooxygenase (ABM) superfamily enzyme
VIICVFGSTVLPGQEAAEAKLSARLERRLRAMPGLISYDEYVSPKGDAIALIRFDREEDLRAWTDDGVHGRAQARTAEFYESFWVQTAVTYREYIWQGGARTDGDLRHLFG